MIALDIALPILLLLVVNVTLGPPITVKPMLACIGEYIGESEKQVDFRDVEVMPGDCVCMLRTMKTKFFLIFGNIHHHQPTWLWTDWDVAMEKVGHLGASL